MGFSLAELQSWDEKGRKKGGGEYLMEVIQGLMKGQKENKAGAS